MNRNDWLRDVVKTQLGDVVQTAIEIGVWRGDFTGTMNSSLNCENNWRRSIITIRRIHR